MFHDYRHFYDVIDYITITCNHENPRLQITIRLLRFCNRFYVITITDYNDPRSVSSFDRALNIVDKEENAGY